MVGAVPRDRFEYRARRRSCGSKARWSELGRLKDLVVESVRVRLDVLIPFAVMGILVLMKANDALHDK